MFKLSKCVKYSIIVCLFLCIILIKNKNNIENFLNMEASTEYDDEGEGSVTYLNNHIVKCNGNISNFKLIRKDGKYRYDYSCINPDKNQKLVITDKKKTKVKKHAWGHKSSKNLLNAKIKCADPNDKDIGLTEFRYNGDGYYDYACGKIVDKTEEEIAQEDARKKEREEKQKKEKKAEEDARKKEREEKQKKEKKAEEDARKKANAAIKKAKEDARKKANAAIKKAKEDAEKAEQEYKEYKKALPKEQGCYLLATKVSGNKCKKYNGKWHQDIKGYKTKDTFNSKSKCLVRPKDFEEECGKGHTFRSEYVEGYHTKPINNDWEHGDKKGNFRRTFVLSGHNVDCGENNFIKDFKLKDLGKKYTYLYKCN